jgi:hypothetical protein
MNLTDTLNYLRRNPGTEATVNARTRIDGMKGPKTIRYNEETQAFEGRRNDEYSTLDKHWLVVTAPGTDFTIATNRATAQAPNAIGGGSNAVETAIRSLVTALRAEVRA